ncbi:MAG: uroporphyrinogen-III synthase [Proteobacteria bacterium]|nr:uroporphyrinogen-III synthase [Pseudomonadota bacterium]MDA0994607.1 uroporphyrinogen-III synthase [Pseudomonadota bacterium]
MSDGPLAGYRVLVTRPALQADELVAAIESAGGEAIRFPVIQIIGHDPDVISGEFASMPRPDIAIFVSVNAVLYGLDPVRSSGAAIAAVGPSTKMAIEAAGVAVSISVDDGFDSESLLGHPALNDVSDKTVTIVRGENGREILGNTLRDRGADVNYLATYRRSIRQAAEDEFQLLEERWDRGEIDCVTVLSVETLENLLLQLPSASLEALRRTLLVAPGARVIQTAKELVPGISAVMASGPRTADILNALIKARQSGQP